MNLGKQATGVVGESSTNVVFDLSFQEGLQAEEEEHGHFVPVAWMLRASDPVNILLGVSNPPPKHKIKIKQCWRWSHQN